MIKDKIAVSVVIPNWNGMDSLGACLDSLLAQTYVSHIIVVENGSVDDSLAFLRKNYPTIELVIHKKNKGFAGGVNAGIRRALLRDDTFVALFNNDAVADKNWLKHLVETLKTHDEAGVVTCKLMHSDGNHLDSTGNIYSVWGLPFPRGRGETTSTNYDTDTNVFGASGGASLYRTRMFREIGLFDEDFFAYYEDIDISFRAQLYGWKVLYEPTALAYHQIGATSSKIKDFTTHQTIKNLPLVVWKNVPGTLLWRVWPRFLLAYVLFCGRAVQRHQFKAALTGIWRVVMLFPKKTRERHHIQHARTVSTTYIWDIMSHDLPPNAHNLRTLRMKWWKITGRNSQ